MGDCHSCRKMGSCTEMLWEGQTGICNILENLSTCALSLVCSLAINFKNVSLYVEYMGVLSKESVVFIMILSLCFSEVLPRDHGLCVQHAGIWQGISF